MATICDVCGEKAVDRVIIDSSDERFDLCLKHINQFLELMKEKDNTQTFNKDGTARKRMGRPPKVHADVIDDDVVGM